MATIDADPRGSLAEILSTRARAAAPSRLALDVVGGAAIAATAAWARPAGWLALASAATCFLSYGLWALTERRLVSEPWRLPMLAERSYRGLHAAAAILGLAAFVALLLALLGIGLGPIIS